MRKLLGTIFLLILLYVGFCGIKVEINGTTYNIPPFISNFFKSDEGKKVGEEAKDLFDAAKNAVSNSIKVEESDSVVSEWY